MILVDTSAWVAALRDASGDAAGHLKSLLDEDLVALAIPVRLEILSGAKAKDLAPLRRLLSALPCWYPVHTTWARIESWVETAIRSGERFGVADLLIAAIATENGASLWTFDRDFQRLASLGLVELHRPA